MTAEEQQELARLRLSIRSRLSGVLIRASVPQQLRAVNLDFQENGFTICLYVWPPDYGAVKAFFEEEILPKYLAELSKLGLPDASINLESIEFAGPGYIVDGQHYDKPVEHQNHGRMVWFDASMLRAGTLPLDVYDPAENPFEPR
jgi:hypothetical protein